MTDFQRYLQKLISEKKLNRADVARRAGKSWTHIHHLFAGFKPAPYPEEMDRLADALGCTPQERAKLLSFAFRRAAGERWRELVKMVNT